MNFGIIHINKFGFIVVCIVIIFFIYMLKSSNNVNEDTNNNKIKLRDLLSAAILSAENGGLEVVRVKDDMSIKIKGLTNEGAQERVTAADYLSHCVMTQTLKRAFPKLNVISEETKTDCDESTDINNKSYSDLPEALSEETIEERDVTVWIDPLDATQEYTEKLYQYVTTMVCVAVKGKPVIGVIHKPFEKKTSWAWVGNARTPDLFLKEDKREKKRIIVSRSHSGKIQELLDKSFNNFELVIAGGAGYKALEVATGKMDAYIHITAIKKWDICAGNAILNAVGGSMTTRFDDVIDYTNLNNVRNENGLIATATEDNHNFFISKLKLK